MAPCQTYQIHPARRLAAVLLAGLLLLTLCPSDCFRVSAEEINLAADAAVIASESFSSPSAINDGERAPASYSGGMAAFSRTVPASIGYSFSDTVTIGKVVVYEYSTRIGDFTLEAATDEGFTDITGTLSDSGIAASKNGSRTLNFDTPVSAKYLRLTINSVKSAGSVFISEIEVYAPTGESQKGVNVAADARVLSSNASGAANINDGAKGGDVSTSSQTTFFNGIGEDRWIGFDFGQAIPLTGMTVYEYSKTSRPIEGFVIETADDEAFTLNVQAAANVTDGGIGGEGRELSFSPSLTARYIRFRPTSYQNPSNPGVIYFAEIEVFSPSALPPKPDNEPNDSANLARQGSAISGKSSARLGYLNDGEKFISNNQENFSMNSTLSDDHWFGIDLGRNMYFNTVEIYEYTQSLKIQSFEVQYSEDGNSYKTLARIEEKGTDRGKAVIQFDAVYARYVRVMLRKISGTVYLDEMEVYYKTKRNEENQNLVPASAVSSATGGDSATPSANAHDRNGGTVWKTNGSEAELTLHLPQEAPLNRLALTLYQPENIGGISVFAGTSPSSLEAVYQDDFQREEKQILFQTPRSVKEIKVRLEGLSGTAGICEIEAYLDASSDAAEQYMYTVSEAVNRYVRQQLAASSHAALPNLNSCVWYSDNSAAAAVNGYMLAVLDPHAGASVSATLSFGEGCTKQVTIPVGNLDSQSFSPVLTETGTQYHFAALDKCSFADIQNNWAYDYIYKLASLKLINGISPTAFEPDRCITRAEFVKLVVDALDLYEADATSNFADVFASSWSYPYIASLEYHGALGEELNGDFHPDSFITREDMAFIAYNAVNAASLELKTGETAVYSDYDSISPYARDGVEFLSAAGLLKGKGSGHFAPKDFLTRSEAAKIIYLLYSAY